MPRSECLVAPTQSAPERARLLVSGVWVSGVWVSGGLASGCLVSGWPGAGAACARSLRSLRNQRSAGASGSDNKHAHCIDRHQGALDWRVCPPPVWIQTPDTGHRTPGHQTPGHQTPDTGHRAAPTHWRVWICSEKWWKVQQALEG
jgi:hypothetical protein